MSGNTGKEGGIARSGRPRAGILGDVVTQPYPLGESRGLTVSARTPVHNATLCSASGECERVCPTQAIRVEKTGSGPDFHLDYGRCIFCRRCVDVCPTGALTATSNFELAVLSREDLLMNHTPAGPSPSKGSGLAKNVKGQVRRIFDGSLAVREVDAGSCGGCELEVHALTWPTYDLERLGIHIVASPRHADALLVTGGVTANMRLALEKTFTATPSPKFVMAVGACGISGGPFRGSPEVRGGVDTTLPVEIYVPGCPPRPEALLYGFWLVLGKVEQRMRNGEIPG